MASEPRRQKKTSSVSYHKKVRVILIGDSVLDNFFWLKDKTLDIEHQLPMVCGETFESVEVVNLAVDGSTTSDVLNGKIPGSGYSNGRTRHGLAPYPTNKKDGKVYPLRVLHENIREYRNSNTFVVLSIGGNDGRANLYGKSSNRKQDIIKCMQQSAFVENYLKICEIIVNKLKLRLICVWVYQPHVSFGVSPKMLQELMAYYFNVITRNEPIIIANCIPFVDLSRTFNPNIRSHYGSTSIEPSNESGLFICDLIHFVVTSHEWNVTNNSKFYFGINPSIKIEDNNAKTRANYLQSMQLLNSSSHVNTSKSRQKTKSYDTESKDSELTQDYSKKNKVRVVLIGDSVLDNFYWLENKKLDIEHQLPIVCGKSFKSIEIVNLAVDESTTSDVLNGKTPSWVYSNDRQRHGLPPYPTHTTDGKVYPLQHLRQNAKLYQKSNTFVVLSIGGNDVRVNLYGSRSTEAVFQAMKKSKFVEKYLKICDIIVNQLKLKLICVWVYQPHVSFGVPPVMLQQLMAHYFNLISSNQEIIIANSIPFIDLSRTFNPHIRSHYGSTAIEPSNKSGEFICELIHKVVLSHKWNDSNKSKVYYGTKPNIMIEHNNGKTRANYLQSLQDCNSRTRPVTSHKLKKTFRANGDTSFAYMDTFKPDSYASYNEEEDEFEEDSSVSMVDKS